MLIDSTIFSYFQKKIEASIHLWNNLVYTHNPVFS